MTNFTALAGAAATALMLAAALPAPSMAADPTAETVVATVNGTDVTLGQMISVRETLPQQYLSLPDDVLFNGILDQIIQQNVLAEKAEGTLTKRQTLELEQQRVSYLANATLDEAVAKSVTDEAVQKAFDEKFASAPPATEYHASHILVKTKEEADAVKARLDAGEDFAVVAKEVSQDPGSAANGGDLGWFGTGMMVEPFEVAVVALKPGETSAPVETQFGFHVIRLVETREAAAPTLDEKREEIVAELQQKAVEAEVKALMDKATVVKTTDGIDPAILKNADLIGQ